MSAAPVGTLVTSGCGTQAALNHSVNKQRARDQEEEVAKVVEITLSITVEIEDEYTSSEQADDILETAKKTFSEAEVKLFAVDVRTKRESPDKS